MRRRLEVTVADAVGRRLRMRTLSGWLERVAPARVHGTVSIALVSDRRVQALNLRYRRINAPTDVLSFPSESGPEPLDLSPGSSKGPSLGPFLGDIVIARGVARRQAKGARHTELTELRVLALHGLLHLLGYDHERDQGQMDRLERRLRAKGGLREGLIERVRTR